MNARHESLDYLTGLRGYAALMVVIAHWVGIFYSGTPEWLATSTRLGAQGVVVFFTLSAFSLSMSADTKNRPWREYAFRRFMRIAPPYYFCLIGALIVGRLSYWSAHFSTPFDAKSFLWHLTFTNWLDYRHANNALGVEWTLMIEVMFYCLFPILLAVSRSAVGCVLLLASALGLQQLQNQSLPIEAWHWSPAPFAICFVIGILTWRIWQRFEAPPSLAWPAIVSVIGVLLVLKPGWGFEWGIVAWSVGASILILTGKYPAGSRVFGNQIAVLIGERSYSIYLVHLPVIYVLVVRMGPGYAVSFLALAGVAIGSELLYRFVEVPTMRWTSRRRAMVPAE